MTLARRDRASHRARVPGTGDVDHASSSHDSSLEHRAPSFAWGRITRRLGRAGDERLLRHALRHPERTFEQPIARSVFDVER